MPCTPTQQQFTSVITGCPIALAVISKKAGCCPEGLPPGPPNTVLGNNPDGQGYAWFLMHPPAHLFSEAAPFSWDDATQCGVIPLPSCLTDNDNGSFTFTPGDGTALTAIQWTITNNPAPFAWNPATWTVNIPRTATLVQNADGSFTFNPGDGSAPVIFTTGAPSKPALTLTTNQDLTTAQPRVTLDIDSQILNIPSAIYAHRRYDGPTQGSNLLPPNTWVDIPLTNMTAGTGIVADTTAGAMTPGIPLGPGGIVIPRTGVYHLWAGNTWQASSVEGTIHLIGITVNGNRYGATPYPGITDGTFNIFTHFRNRLQAGDVIGVQLCTKDPVGNEHVSIDLTVEWIAD